MVATAISSGLRHIYLMRRLRTSCCAFSFEHVHVVSASPRILAASIVARYCRILALVLHIPTSKAKLAARQAVYDDALLILKSCARFARHVFVFIYFNGTAGEFASPGMGTCGGAAPLDAGGELIANFVVRWPLCAPATFESCQQGPTATWTYAIGCSSREDLVLCSTDLQMGLPPLGSTRPLIFCRRKLTIVPAFCKAALYGHKLRQRSFDVLCIAKGVT